MKSLPSTVNQVGPAVAILCILAAPAFAQSTTGVDTRTRPTQEVTIEKDGILIHPGAKISKSDQNALNDILTKYNKSLYKIETYKNGKLKKTQGQLSDVYIDKTIASEAADAKATGVSDRTLQIITPANPQQAPGATTNPQQSPGNTTNPQRSPGATTNPQQTPGATTNPQQSPGATTNPQQATQSPSPANERASRELIERLKPILEKYSKK